jgi:hypothetical protein
MAGGRAGRYGKARMCFVRDTRDGTPCEVGGGSGCACKVANGYWLVWCGNEWTAKKDADERNAGIYSAIVG